MLYRYICCTLITIIVFAQRQNIIPYDGRNILIGFKEKTNKEIEFFFSKFSK